MTSIFEGQPLETNAFSKQKTKGHLYMDYSMGTQYTPPKFNSQFFPWKVTWCF